MGPEPGAFPLNKPLLESAVMGKVVLVSLN